MKLCCASGLIGAIAMLTAIAEVPAAASLAQMERGDWDRDYRALGRIAQPCREADRRTGPPHVINAEREAIDLVQRMLTVDAATCPGVAAAALERLKGWVGTVERADADDGLLRMLHGAADRGLGGPADPALAERIGRMLWLISENRPRLTWSEEERWAFLMRPETVALLEARAAQSGQVRAWALLGEARLREGSPAYDPPRAIALLEGAARSHQDRVRVTGLLTDGRLVPIDYRRAADLWVRELSYTSDRAGVATELLRIGNSAAAAARTPPERAVALRILSAAAVDGGRKAAAARDALLNGLGLIRSTLFPVEMASQLAPVLAEIPIAGVSPPENGARPGPVRVRALVGPDGRVVMVQLRQGIGEPHYDRAVLATWARHGHHADLGAIASGAFAWTELPPLTPRYAIESR